FLAVILGGLAIDLSAGHFRVCGMELARTVRLDGGVERGTVRIEKRFRRHRIPRTSGERRTAACTSQGMLGVILDGEREQCTRCPASADESTHDNRSPTQGSLVQRGGSHARDAAAGSTNLAGLDVAA